MSVMQQKSMTAEEYLAQERQAEEKSEFYQGECFAMAGASRRHNILTGNSFRMLANYLLGKPCQPYVADMRLHIEAYEHYVYPDVLVVCDEKAYVDEDNCNDATVISVFNRLFLPTGQPLRIHYFPRYGRILPVILSFLLKTWH